MPRHVLHFGGNGHACVRLDAAQDALSRLPGAPLLIDVPYPGFENRPPAPNLDAFLDQLAAFCGSQSADAGYASGIGALIALSLRARGELTNVPLIFQGPVLWGLKHRLFPRAMRAFPPARAWLQRAFLAPRFQDRFLRKQFQRPLTGETRRRFFQGYADCPAFGSFFAWFTPEFLVDLESQVAERPDALANISIWLGAVDHVVGPDELSATRQAVGVDWPLVTFPGWGHYPMLDEPEGWADALRDALATA